MAGRRRAYGSGSVWRERRKRFDVWMGQVRITPEGGTSVQRQRVLGRVRTPGANDGMTRQMAERALRDLRAEVEEELARARVNQERVLTETTLREAGEHYLRHLRTRRALRRATLADYEMYLRRHLAGSDREKHGRGARPPKHPPFFADRTLRSVGREDVDAYVEHKRGVERIAASTIGNHLSFLSALFEHAQGRGWCEHNPVRGVERPRTEQKITEDLQFLDLHEIEAVLRACGDDDRGLVDHAAFTCAFMTGLRRGELIALRWRDVDWVQNLVRVRRTYARGEFCPPKTRRSRRDVPMTRRVAETLARHRDRSHYSSDEDLVFCHPHTGRPYDPDTLSARFRETLDRAGVRSLSLHKARHSFASALASAGVPLRGLMEFMGHADVATTMIYAHFYSDGHDLIERAFVGRPIEELTAN